MIGLLDPETLHTRASGTSAAIRFWRSSSSTPIRANPVEGDFDKRRLDPAYIREQERWSRAATDDFGNWPLSTCRSSIIRCPRFARLWSTASAGGD